MQRHVEAAQALHEAVRWVGDDCVKARIRAGRAALRVEHVHHRTAVTAGAVTRAVGALRARAPRRARRAGGAGLDAHARGGVLADRRQRQRRLDTEKNYEGSSNQNHRRLARPFGYLEDNGTSHMSAVDSDGNAVAITTSINNIFGSQVYSKTTGVLLGNTMDDFGVPVGEPDAYGIMPSEANFIVPGKRVRCTACMPSIRLKFWIGGMVASPTPIVPICSDSINRMLTL